MSVATEQLGYRRVHREQFGETRLGQPVDKIVLTNANGVRLEAIEYGAIISRIYTPDRNGKSENIVLGYDTLEEYEDCEFYIGAAIGRFAGRIANAQYFVAGHHVKLDNNWGRHHLHGGARGFHKAVWSTETSEGPQGATIKFSRIFPDGDGGHPGKLAASIKYTLTDRNELVIEYGAATDKPTHVNLTQHSYFQLSGERTKNAEDAHLSINADCLLGISDDALPTGEIVEVAETSFDFRAMRQVGACAADLDHDFVLRSTAGEFVHAARLFDPDSGRYLDVSTDQPSLHVYAGRSLGEENGSAFPRCAGLCLETQHFPDAPNRSHFPSTLLLPGNVFKSRTIFKFGAQKKVIGRKNHVSERSFRLY